MFTDNLTDYTETHTLAEDIQPSTLTRKHTENLNKVEYLPNESNLNPNL